MSEYVREQLERQLRGAYWRSEVALKQLEQLRLIENARSASLRAQRECYPKHAITYPAREMTCEEEYWKYLDQQQQQAKRVTLDHNYLEHTRASVAAAATQAAILPYQSTLSYTARIQHEQQQQQQQQQTTSIQTTSQAEPTIFIRSSTPTTLDAQQAGCLYKEAIRISEPKVVKEGPAGPAFYPNLIERQVVRQIEVPWQRTVIVPTSPANVTTGVKSNPSEPFRIDHVQGTRIFEVSEAQLYTPLSNQPTGPARILGATPVGYTQQISRAIDRAHDYSESNPFSRSAPIMTRSHSMSDTSRPKTPIRPQRQRPASAAGHRPTPTPVPSLQQPQTTRKSSMSQHICGHPFEEQVDHSKRKYTAYQWKMRGGGALPTHRHRLTHHPNDAWLSITPKSISAGTTPRAFTARG